MTGWLKAAEVEDGSLAGTTAAHNAEPRELCRGNRLSERVNEVLRRTAGYLSQANLPGKSSTRS
jgi:hypothetical protein